MIIRIYGTGCARCRTLAENVEAAVRDAALAVTVEKITDIEALVARGILSTPALEIDGELVVSGRVLTPRQLRRLLAPDAPARPVCQKPEKQRVTARRIAAAALALFALAGVAWPFLRDLSSKAHAPAVALPAPADESAQTVVYYFHGSRRCRTCNRIEQLARAAVEERFPEALATGLLRFASVDVDEAANEHFIHDFRLSFRTVVVAKGGSFERLDKVWQLASDEAAFRRYIQDGVAALLGKE